MKTAFNTANLVGRVSGYRFTMSEWGKQADATASSMTDREWGSICSEIAGAGYHAAEVWVAHVDPRFTTEAGARKRRAIMDDHGLEPIGLGGGLTPQNARICQWMGMPVANGGFGGTSIAEVRRVIRETGIGCNFENHPEKSAAEMRAAIEGGGEKLGLCVDTGWLGSNGIDAPRAVRELGPLIRHVHVKDVRSAGSHVTCPLGEGCVGISGVIAALHDIGYAGWLSWEDEPEDRNPLDIAPAMRVYIEKELTRPR
jgi:sugar phosphate isomerase/epimerase